MKKSIFFLWGAFFWYAAVAQSWQHGFSTFGTLKYPPSFSHFNTVNPHAPQGGDLVLEALGQFDSFNPYILKGTAAAGLSFLGGNLLHASLFKPSDEEHGSSYGYVASQVSVSADQTQVTFFLRKEAVFHDGSPILPEDVIFTFAQLQKHGKPFYRTYYQAVERVEKTGPQEVTFFLNDTSSREIPTILGQLPVLSRKFYAGDAFLKTSLLPPVGSGPYRVEKVLPGQSVTYKKVHNWWGSAVPAAKGYYNFERIRYDYYRDPSVAFEAFKAGNVDFTVLSSKNWVTIQEFPAVKQGKMNAAVVPHQIPVGHVGFFFNLRRSLFQDPRVRQALGLVFDFEWINKNLLFSTYQRVLSYFANTRLAAIGMPSPQELTVLDSFQEPLPEGVRTQPIDAFVGAGPFDPRQRKRAALVLLNQAGWHLKKGRLTHVKTGEPFVFEFLSLAGSSFEKITGACQQSLKEMLGITMKIRVVDPSQYEHLTQNFDFDMAMSHFPGSTHPGNELWNYLGSKQATQKGSSNLAGIQNPVVDHLIQKIIDAPDEPALKLYTNVLDRVLMASFYTIPGWYSPTVRVAYWHKFGKQPRAPLSGYDYLTWWTLPTEKKRQP